MNIHFQFQIVKPTKIQPGSNFSTRLFKLNKQNIFSLILQLNFDSIFIAMDTVEKLRCKGCEKVIF